MTKPMPNARPKGVFERQVSREQTEFVKLIRHARHIGWTLEDLAERLGTTAASISRWDRGTAVPFANTARRLLPKLRRLLG